MTGQNRSPPLCASEIGLHFRPACFLLPFILNGALGPQKPHCVSEQSSSPEGPSEGAPLDPHRYSFSELISCITSLHKYFTGLWSKPTSVSLCLPNCFGSYMCILDMSSTLKLALQKPLRKYHSFIHCHHSLFSPGHLLDCPEQAICCIFGNSKH